MAKEKKKKRSFTSLLSKLLDSPKSSLPLTTTTTTTSLSDPNSSQPDPLDPVVRGLSSDRLFFDPGDTSPALEQKKVAFVKESVVLAMESSDPYRDFRVSMEEMVVAHGITNYEQLEELLIWYLRVNGKKVHGFIVGAFVDVILGFGSSSCCCCSCSSSCF